MLAADKVRPSDGAPFFVYFRRPSAEPNHIGGMDRQPHDRLDRPGLQHALMGRAQLPVDR